MGFFRTRLLRTSFAFLWRALCAANVARLLQRRPIGAKIELTEMTGHLALARAEQKRHNHKKCDAKRLCRIHIWATEKEFHKEKWPKITRVCCSLIAYLYKKRAWMCLLLWRLSFVFHQYTLSLLDFVRGAKCDITPFRTPYSCVPCLVCIALSVVDKCGCRPRA